MTCSVFVIVAMKFVTGTSVHFPVPEFQRLVRETYIPFFSQTNVNIVEIVTSNLSISIYCACQQGGSSQVRFQPISGRLLAAASDKVVSIFDVETDMQTHSFQVWHLMLFVSF